jgi:Spy/CpxP family protein refolding chaperone
MSIRAGLMIAALGMSGAAGFAASGAWAATDTDSVTVVSPGSGSPPAWHGHRRPGMLTFGMLRAFKQLNLTEAQQQSVHTILANARKQFTAERQANAPNFTALSNPGDPNYAAALAAAKTAAANRVQEIGDIKQQLYGVLTPQQQAQLPQVLASIQAQFAQRRAARQQS